MIPQATKRVTPSQKAQNLAERFRKHGDAHFRFRTTPEAEPPNNLAGCWVLSSV